MDIMMTQQQARELRDRFVAELHRLGIIPSNERSVPYEFGRVDWEVRYGPVPGYRYHRIPEDKRNWGVSLSTGESRYSTPRRKKTLHRNLPTLVDRVVKVVNAKRDSMLRDDVAKMAKAQKDFDRGWCAHRKGLTCKLINGRFHALVRVGGSDIWQDDVEYAVSHDTLVFKSEIGKVDRWITIETLQLLLDKGVLLNPKEVKFVGDE